MKNNPITHPSPAPAFGWFPPWGDRGAVLWSLKSRKNRSLQRWSPNPAVLDDFYTLDSTMRNHHHSSSSFIIIIIIIIIIMTWRCLKEITVTQQGSITWWNASMKKTSSQLSKSQTPRPPSTIRSNKTCSRLDRWCWKHKHWKLKNGLMGKADLYRILHIAEIQQNLRHGPNPRLDCIKTSASFATRQGQARIFPPTSITSILKHLQASMF